MKVKSFVFSGSRSRLWKEYLLESLRKLGLCRMQALPTCFSFFPVLAETLLPLGWRQLGSRLAEALWEWPHVGNLLIDSSLVNHSDSHVTHLAYQILECDEEITDVSILGG